MKMRKYVAIMMAAAMAMGLTACGGSSGSQTAATTAAAEAAKEETAEESKDDAVETVTEETAEATGDAVNFDEVDDVYAIVDAVTPDYKIGIMTSGVDQGEERYREALRLQEKYGEDKILVDTFPASAVSEQETTISKVMAMAADPDVKAIVFNQAQDGTIASIKKIKEVRDDILTIACNPNEDYDETASVADVVLCKDQLGFADQFIGMATEMGAKNFLHYTFPRHMSNQNIAARAERMKELCEQNGINYVEVMAPDPQGDAGTAGTQQFILEDVPRQIKELGPDSVFFATNTAMHDPMIKCVFEGKAMYCGQSDPSPFSGFPAALGIEVPEDKIGDVDFIVEAIQEKVDELGMSGRISTWPSSLDMLYVDTGVLFARLYCDGVLTETKGEMPLSALKAILRTLSGEGAVVDFWTNNDGKTYDYVFQLLGGQHKF